VPDNENNDRHCDFSRRRHLYLKEGPGEQSEEMGEGS
jgi:hypothetical protein